MLLDVVDSAPAMSGSLRGAHACTPHPISPPGAAQALVLRGEVAVPVDEAPLPVLAPVDVGDAAPPRSDRAAVDGELGAFVADGVAQVAADLGDLDVEGRVAAVRHAAGDPAERAVQLVPSGAAGPPRAEQA